MFYSGENIHHNFYKTGDTRVTECLLIPRDVFLSHVSLKNQLNLLADDLNYKRKSTQDVYRLVQGSIDVTRESNS